MKRLALLVSVVALAGCGGKPMFHATTTTAAPPAPTQTPKAAMDALIASDHALAGSVQTLYSSNGWAVVESVAPGKATALAFHLVGRRWHAERTQAVRIEILGPHPGQGGLAPITQVAVEIKAHSPFVESGLWVDGTYLANIQGGGNADETDASVYGSPAHALKRGIHVAVGYARTATAASAVAWLFTVS